MDPKKLAPQDAFDQLMVHQNVSQRGVEDEEKDVEERFGQMDGRRDRPRWLKIVRAIFFISVAAMLIVGVGKFYWFITTDAEPAFVIKPPKPLGPAVIGEAEAKQMIEANLKAFLSAETNEERLRYVYLPEDEMAWLQLYYEERGLRDTPMWKIERMELSTSAGGEIWFVIFADVKKNQHVVSFQRYGDDYRLHWSAMKAFSEMPWPRFIVSRPEGPVMMRGYLRQYDGVWPLGIFQKDYHCFLIEDRDGLFSELAIMRKDSMGYASLKYLPKSSRHPVTVRLGYRALTGGSSDRKLTVLSLIHLRWQKMVIDPQIQGGE